MQNRLEKLIPGAQRRYRVFSRVKPNELRAPSLIGPATTRASAGARMTRGGLSCSDVWVIGYFAVGF